MDITAAIFGLLGVAVGGLLQILAQYLSDRRGRATDKARMALLREMLNDRAHPWRDLETCSRVIGADRDTTIRLLVEAGARGSEKEGERELWGLLSRNPFPRRG